MPEKLASGGPDDEDTRLLVIDLGGGLVHGVETNIPYLAAVKVIVLGDRNDGDGVRDEIVVEDIDRIVSLTGRAAIENCEWLATPLAQADSGVIALSDHRLDQNKPMLREPTA